MRWLPLLIVLSLMVGMQPATAQQRRPERLLPQVFPQMTGRDRYEDLLKAADLAAESKLLPEAEAPDAALTVQRLALHERAVVSALRLIHESARKPLVPHSSQGHAVTNAIDFGLESVAALLKLEQEVAFADGRLLDALASAEEEARLGLTMQGDDEWSLVWRLHFTENAALGLGSHLDQLSAPDHERLFSMCQEWLRAPSPELRVLASYRTKERADWLKFFEKTKQSPVKEPVDTPPNPDANADDLEFIRAVRQLVRTPRNAIDPIAREFDQNLNEYYQRLFQETARPFWERRGVVPRRDHTIGGTLAAHMVNEPTSRFRDYAVEQSRIRQLACHAAIHRYRWEHKKLPPNLEALHLGELPRDPFTGEWLRYEVRGRNYRLSGSALPPIELVSTDQPKRLTVTPED